MQSISRRRFIRVLGGTTFTFAAMPDLARAMASKAPYSGVLVEAEQFADPGGWVRDTQFIHEMGGAYLLAHGMGDPVANAKTTTTFKEGGLYSVLVRAKDWCPGEWQSPGRFKVRVNGKPLEKTFGESGKDWGWEDAGTIQVQPGEMKIELEDLTGFGGRCDAIYFSKNYTGLPPNDAIELPKWKDAVSGRSPLPSQTLDFDVVIVGGGMTGCGAAIAADSQGLRVALVQDRPMLGGNASAEVRVHTIGIAGKNADLIKRIDTEHYPNGHADAIKDQVKRDAEMAKTSVKIFTDHRAIGLEMAGGKIASIDARETGTGVITRFKAPVFIDCTGDAWLGQWSGAEKRYGRESKDEFNEGWDKYGERWAPKVSDNRVMGTSVLWNSEKSDKAEPFPAVPWAMPVAKKHQAINGEWYWEYSDNRLNQITDAEQVRDHMFRAIYGSFANAKKEPKNATVKLKWVAYVGGKRESWRLMGDYIFTQEDAMKGTEFEDAVVEETRALDGHYQRKYDGINVDFLSEAMFRHTPRYYVPFRCLYSKNIPNLMMAGRCFSCSHIGLGGPRVMKTCAQMGVAVGYAAAMCKKHKALPREVGKMHIKELRGLIGYA
ncbi:MAG: FAD-dependent oxidoreductase [Phycisphaeraceae bacterium]|nr:FAD-dependent oxidoreductase [Phycisphaeraceae bacterium]